MCSRTLIPSDWEPNPMPVVLEEIADVANRPKPRTAGSLLESLANDSRFRLPLDPAATIAPFEPVRVTGIRP